MNSRNLKFQMRRKALSISMKQKEQYRSIIKLHYDAQCEFFTIFRKDIDKIYENSNGILVRSTILPYIYVHVK